VPRRTRTAEDTQFAATIGARFSASGSWMTFTQKMMANVPTRLVGAALVTIRERAGERKGPR